MVLCTFIFKTLSFPLTYQGYGLGRALMERVERYLSKACRAGATVALLAVRGKESFYRDYGYIERDGVNLGNGMCRFIRG